MMVGDVAWKCAGVPRCTSSGFENIILHRKKTDYNHFFTTQLFVEIVGSFPENIV